MDTFIECGKEKLSLNIVNSARESNNFLILCFGGSKTNFKERYRGWQNILAKNGINSVSFDYSGTGRSTNIFSSSSLKKRIEETKCVISWIQNNYGGNASLNLLGESMGAYITLGAINNSIKKLILMVPAAYSPAAHLLHFNKKFTAEIHKERSWRNSFSFKWLRDFPNKVLLLSSEKDSVIPREILEKYKNYANKKSFQYYEIANAPHGIWGNYTNRREIQNFFLQKIISFIKK